MIGYIALILVDLAYLPELFNTYKAKRCEISWLTLIMLTVGMILWIIYAASNSDVPLTISSSVSMVQLFFLLYYKLRQRGSQSNNGINISEESVKP